MPSELAGDDAVSYDPISGKVLAWYQENADEAAAVMIEGTKGHMLACEAVPALVREVKLLREVVVLVCSHPRVVKGACAYCGRVPK